MREWHALRRLAVLAFIGSCSQSDLIAIRLSADAGAESDAGSMGSACAPQTCPALASLGEKCISGDALVRVGDSCARSGNADRGLRFNYGVCSCSELIAMGPVNIYDQGSLGINSTIRSELPVIVTGDIVIATELADNDASDLRAANVRAGSETPCACGDEDLLDIPALVRAHEVDTTVVARDALRGFQGATSLTLGCGRYYFDGISGDSPLTLRIEGRAAVFVAGDVALDDGFSATLAEGASLDLFVAGNVRVVGPLELGQARGAEHVNVYVGGGGTVDLNSSTQIAGHLYAPHAELVSRGDLTLDGSLFARRIAASGALSIYYASAAAESDCVVP
jgi:hypothetical protein